MIRPILFSASMVHAILDDRKTQTRRVIATRHCPYGTMGDELWVKESWRTRASLDRRSPSTIADMADDAGFTRGDRCPLQYAADGHETRWGDNDERDFGPWGRWRSSLHMPRWASRITLAITGVRIQRLQEITEEDAKAEGVVPSIVGEDLDHLKHRAGFQTLWDAINGKRGFAWSSDPWVWAITFERNR